MEESFFFTIFDPQGRIIGAGFDETIPPDAIEGNYSGEIFYIDPDERVAVPFPLRPGEFHDWDYALKAWVANTELMEALARTQRDRLLAECDWTQMPDVALEQKSAWAAYRQALRDVPGQAGFPEEIDWPDPPGL
jgi:hypothetical protein